jgi:two-component system, LytTR family, sensor kinase
LGRLAALILEELERFRTTEMQRLVSQAELKALQSQINPHFLFNALNTLYGIIPREVAGARSTVLNLAEIFRYFLQAEKMFIPLSEELKIINAYLEIESLRLGPRLRTEIDIDDDALSVPIPILSVQPLVENAIKHGLSARLERGWLRVSAKIVNQEVIIAVEDSGRGAGPVPAGLAPPGAGVGLANVTRRLQLCYGLQAGVLMQSGPSGTRVHFRIPSSRLVPTS